jgi:transcriptional regulator with XRE-family HTH domain
MSWKASSEYGSAVNRAVGIAIRQARDACGMTQDALATIIGVSRASIANIERGEQTVGVPLLLRLSDALSVPPAHLLQEPDDEDRAWLRLTESDRALLEPLADDERAKRWVASFFPDVIVDRGR